MADEYSESMDPSIYQQPQEAMVGQGGALGGYSYRDAQISKEQAYMASLMDIRKPNLPARLRRQKLELEKRLEDVNKALKLVEENPNLVEFIQALEKVGGY